MSATSAAITESYDEVVAGAKVKLRYLSTCKHRGLDSHSVVRCDDTALHTVAHSPAAFLSLTLQE